MSSEEVDVFKLKYRDNKEQKALTEKENQKMCMTFGKKKKKVLWKFYDAHKEKSIKKRSGKKPLRKKV